MNLNALCAVHALAAMLGASPAGAQDAPAHAALQKPDPQLERVIVKLAGPKKELRGRLLRLDSRTLSIQLDNRTLDLPIERVLQIDVVRRDSLVNGAIFGAIYVAACAKWWCSQGTSRSHDSSIDVLLGAGMGALVGAGVDALRNKRTTLFKAGGSTGQMAGADVSFRVRF